MLDRLVVRLTLWSTLTAVPAVAAAATVSDFAPVSLQRLAPAFAGAAVLVAVVGWHLLRRDFGRQRAEEIALRERMQRLDEAMQASADGMYVLRAVRDELGALQDFEFAEANGTAAALLYRTRDTLIGCRLLRDIGGPFAHALFERYAWALTTDSPLVEEVRVDRRTVAAGWLQHQAMPTSEGLAVTARDISARKREERVLRRACLTDDLTGLYNRRGFMALAEQQLRVVRRQGSDAVVMYADMDGFKQLNDQHGHAVGDRALVLVGRLLRETVRDSDVVARLGGDEFTILACDADGVGARVIQRRIEERLALVNASGELPAPLHLTIGYTRVRPSDPAGVSELLARADQLLYARKRRRHLTRVHGAAEAAAVTPSARPSRRAPATAPRTLQADVSTPIVPPDVAAVA